MKGGCMNDTTSSIFQSYYSETTVCTDRFQTDSQNGIDVIIPILQTNKFWKQNLLSIYREIPVNRLLVGDNGCKDGGIDTLKDFPRVELFDHSAFLSPGYSACALIKEVKTAWFVYMQPDAYLPEGWFDTLSEYRSKAVWLESQNHITLSVDQFLDSKQPFVAAQMGRKDIVEPVIHLIEDDYLYMGEHVILQKLLEYAGYECQKVDEVHHYTQVDIQDTWRCIIEKGTLSIRKEAEDEIYFHLIRLRAFIKYLRPDPLLVDEIRESLRVLFAYDALYWEDFKKWVIDTNPAWWLHVKALNEKLRPQLQAYSGEKKASPSEETKGIFEMVRRLLRPVQCRYLMIASFAAGFFANKLFRRYTDQQFQERWDVFLKAAADVIYHRHNER